MYIPSYYYSVKLISLLSLCKQSLSTVLFFSFFMFYNIITMFCPKFFYSFECNIEIQIEKKIYVFL